MGLASSLAVVGAWPWMRGLLCFAMLGISDFRATAKDETAATASAIKCEVRYHFRERMEGVKPDGKQYSAPSYERERVVDGRVAHLPYRFEIKFGEKGAGVLEVNILGGDGKPLHGYPKTIANASTGTVNRTSQEFEIPVAPDLARTIEKTLLAKNQHLTEIQLVVESSP
jgi:hypothetical protein